MNTNENDWLKGLFSRLPGEEPSASFREDMMKRIMAEAIRIKKRNERLGWLSVILASLVIVGLAIASLIYTGIPKITIRIPDLTTLSFYLFIGSLALILLTLDHYFRQAYKKKHQ
ncbi:hypothetical protein AGMMS49574_11900 [Bacteroidia bacterium]|nr:hypothetical protein AGMMS49574_11900 [Bacteroidia bacterium]GHU54349.1 hypothetical protein FACS189411_00850 [Bacteroidia bacterium]GHV03595.1 hypothetical protein FACS189416_0220 [Bacteroidia bacterium]